VNLDLNAEEESKALDTLQKEEDMSLHVHCNNCGVNALPDVRKEVYEGSNIMPGGHTELYDACVRCGSEDIITLEDFNDKAI
jgi:ribosomal protein L37E